MPHLLTPAAAGMLIDGAAALVSECVHYQLNTMVTSGEIFGVF